MSNAAVGIPRPSHHKASGQSVVRLNGHDFYLGPHASPEAKVEYDRKIAEWLAHGRQLPDPNAGRSVAELIVAYLDHAERYYSKGGKPTSEFGVIFQAMKWLKRASAKTPVDQFGPRAFKTARQMMIDAGMKRPTVNGYMNRIRRCFRWGVEQELVPANVYHSLQAVTGLKRGRSEAEETAPVKPVPQARIDAVLPQVAPQVAAMINFQLLTGCRPGEVCILRGCDIEMTGRVWIFRPPVHKTDHHGLTREIFIGPKAQKVIRPWLRTEFQAYLFQPCEAEAVRNAKRRENRKSPMTPLQSARRPKKSPKWVAGSRYTSASYRGAIDRGCEIAFEMPAELRKILKTTPEPLKSDLATRAAAWRKQHCWNPNQLRHNAATNLRKEFGVELARIILGHTTAFTTEIYAEVDRKQAIEVIGKVG